ncbi:condensation domain-containing protein [Amycolatopsis sp. lyj-23]|uniref:condensation domain-containing protein n=1 Tax=Amycolatopsis sp. lyj-23 TaxID=2789283 RepID=UPI00397B3AFF
MSGAEAIPLSYGQEGLWFLHRLGRAGATYHVPLQLALSGVPAEEPLRAALGDVLDRHEILRTVFREQEGTPVQHILEPRPPDWPPLRVVPAGAGVVDSEDSVDSLVTAAVRGGFDLAAGPLLRAWLFVLTDGTSRLLLVLHHAVADGWSIAPLLADLATAYRARSRGHPPVWPAELPVQYADYTLWQRELLGDPADPAGLAGRQLAFWRRRLSGVPAEVPLPITGRRPERPVPDGAVVPFHVGPASAVRLADLAREHRTSLFMVLYAGLAAVLHVAGGGRDIVIGAPVAGRTDTALEPLVGYFVNTLVLRVDVTGEDPFTALLDRARAVVLAAQAHQDVPFEKVVEAVNPPRAPGRHPLFQIALLLRNDTTAPVEFGDCVGSLLPARTGTAKFDLTFAVEAGDPAAGFAGTLEYAIPLVDADGAGWLARSFEAVLDQVAAVPGLPLGTLVLPDRPAPGRAPSSVPSSAPRPAPVVRDETLERRLSALFGEVLGVDGFDPASSFFDAGGHSLLAAKLARHVERSLDHRIDLWTLVAAPSPRELAARLSAGEATTGAPAVTPLRSGGDAPPLFCVPPAAGVSSVYLDLARHLPPEVPVLGLDSPLLTTGRHGRWTFGDLAADLVSRIGEVSSPGGYRLLGWSFGGNLAHAAAAGLREAGERVGLLTLLDAHPYPPKVGGVPDEAVLRRSLGLSTTDELPAEPGTLVATFAASLAALPPRPSAVFDGDLLFFRASRNPEPADPARWQPYVGGRITTHDVDCAHGELTGPAALRRLGPLLAHALSTSGR